jgi:hypothetical protein
MLLVRARAIQAELRKLERRCRTSPAWRPGRSHSESEHSPREWSCLTPFVKFGSSSGSPSARRGRVCARVDRAGARRSLDFAMGPRFDNRSLDPAFTFRPLFREQFAVVAQRHPLAGARSFAELADAEWLRMQGSAGRSVGSIALSKRPVYSCPDRSFTAIR